MKGDDQERAFMSVLRGHEMLPMRSPGSGTGDWDQPDVLAGADGVILASELKAGAEPSNVREAEVAALKAFAKEYWAAALIVIRYKGDRTFYLVQPDLLDRTPSGHYSIPTDEKRLNWDVALPYEYADGGRGPRFEVGDDGVIYDVSEQPPSLTDWLDAVNTDQQSWYNRRPGDCLSRYQGDDDD